MSDPIERQAAIDAINKYACNTQRIYEAIKTLPSAQPSAQPYSEADIQKIQDLEQAEIQKAFELGKGEGRKEAQPEIIRCKECKHQEKFFHEDKRRKEDGYYIFGCELASEYSHVCLDEDFCSRAERRTDEVQNE